MIVLRGDLIRTKSGDTGEVIDTWGVARSFVRFKRESDGKAIPIFQDEVEAVLRRPSAKRTRQKD